MPTTRLSTASCGQDGEPPASVRLHPLSRSRLTRHSLFPVPLPARCTAPRDARVSGKGTRGVQSWGTLRRSRMCADVVLHPSHRDCWCTRHHAGSYRFKPLRLIGPDTSPDRFIPPFKLSETMFVIPEMWERLSSAQRPGAAPDCASPVASCLPAAHVQYARTASVRLS